ncbi:MAG: O-antigen ligase family protein, partial [Chloroflexota bacterium]
SQSRGAILLGLPAGVIALLIVWRGRRAAAPVAAALAAIAVVLVPLSIALPRLRDLLGETAFFRRHLWYSALNLIREHPITGAGLDQFLYWYRSRYLLPDAWAEPNLSIPHNVLLNHWVSLGLGGVLLGVAFQVAFWRGVWRARGRLLDDHLLLALALGLAGSMAHALAHGLVDVSYFSINLAFVFFLSLGLLHHLERLADEKAAE